MIYNITFIILERKWPLVDGGGVGTQIEYCSSYLSNPGFNFPNFIIVNILCFSSFAQTNILILVFLHHNFVNECLQISNVAYFFLTKIDI